MLDVILFKHNFKKIIAEVLPPSLINTLGVPNLVKIFFFKKLTTVLASLATQGIASIHLMTLSTHTSIWR